jgi:hypothetical protein
VAGDNELALIDPAAGPGDPLPAAALAARLAAPNLFDYLMQPPASPVGPMPTGPGRLPPEWQSRSALDAIPALTDVAGTLPGPAGAIFVGPGSRLLAGAVREVPRDPALRDAFIQSVQRIRGAAGLEPASFPIRANWPAAAGASERTEIQDTGARLVPGDKPGEYLWQHPAGDLHALYDVPPIKFSSALRTGDAQVDVRDRQITVGGEASDPANMSRANYIVSHEFQHIIQDAEGLPGGSSIYRAIEEPEYWSRTGRPMPTSEQELTREAQKLMLDYRFGGKTDDFKTAFDIYSRSAGEVEARNVERRMENPALYASAPQTTEDIARPRQLVRYTTPPDGVPRRLTPVAGDPFAMRLTLEPTETEGIRPLTRAAGEAGFDDFHIRDDRGEHVGEVTINSKDPKNLWVEWIGAHGAYPFNALGPKEIRSLLDSVRTRYPEAETISGFRASGARWLGKPSSSVPEASAAGYEPVIRLRGGKPPPEFENISQSMKVPEGASLPAGEPEHIVSAAVRLTDGSVHTAPTHGEAAWNAAHSLGVPLGKVTSGMLADVGGFVTSKGRYVGRTEAAQIAERARQIGSSQSTLYGPNWLSAQDFGTGGIK